MNLFIDVKLFNNILIKNMQINI